MKSPQRGQKTDYCSWLPEPMVYGDQSNEMRIPVCGSFVAEDERREGLGASAK